MNNNLQQQHSSQNNQPSGLTCRACGSSNIQVQVIREGHLHIVTASRTVTYAVCQNCGNRFEVGSSQKNKGKIPTLIIVLFILIVVSLIATALNLNNQ